MSLRKALARNSAARIAGFVLTVLAAPAALTADDGHGGKDLGTVSFPVSCRPELVPAFERAVALLHSFEYAAARTGFEQVAADDPACAMAQWGIAMTLYHPLWAAPNPAETAQGQQASARAAELAAASVASVASVSSASPGHPSERERGFITAIGRFWGEAGAVDHRTRAARYRDAMGELSRRFPDDAEAAIFYALAILGTAPPADPAHALQKQAAEILATWLPRLPDHPGITHYSIHAFDSPQLAYLGLEGARRYALLAPAAAHALHMPSHIFTRLGLWPEAIASNLDGAATERAAALRAGTSRVSSEELHALDYLEYAYLQTGDDDKARAVAERAARSTAIEDAIGASYGLLAIPARFTLERRQWAAAAALTLPAIGGVDWAALPQMAAITAYAQAVGAAKVGDVAAAGAAVARLDELQKRLVKAPPPGPYDWAAHVESLRLTAAGCLEHARRNDAAALALLGQGADLGDRTGKHPVTPGAVLPQRELLADLYLELGRPGDALREFEASLAVAPNRLNALAGAAQAADLAGETSRSRTYYNLLASIAIPGSSRAEVVAARRRLAD